MGETIDQTRLEIAAQRAELEATAARLRDASTWRKRVRENPGIVIGIGAATVFLVVGGPRRLARLLRGDMAPHAAEEAYDALPEHDAGMGRRARRRGRSDGRPQVRDELVEELRRWRRDPIKDKKARKELARQMVEGPPGPQRTAWNAAETALTLIAAALARRAVARFLTDEARQAVRSGRDGAAEPTPGPRMPRPGRRPAAAEAGANPSRRQYSGWSSR